MPLINVLLFVIDALDISARVFALGNPLQLCQMFIGMTMNLHLKSRSTNTSLFVLIVGDKDKKVL
jgi:hypothetical protein